MIDPQIVAIINESVCAQQKTQRKAFLLSVFLIYILIQNRKN